MALTTLGATRQLDQGGAVFETDVEPITKGILVGMCANSELIRCQYGEFTWYVAHHQKPSESAADIAYKIAKVMNK